MELHNVLGHYEYVLREICRFPGGFLFFHDGRVPLSGAELGGIFTIFSKICGFYYFPPSSALDRGTLPSWKTEKKPGIDRSGGVHTRSAQEHCETPTRRKVLEV